VYNNATKIEEAIMSLHHLKSLSKLIIGFAVFIPLTLSFWPHPNGINFYNPLKHAFRYKLDKMLGVVSFAGSVLINSALGTLMALSMIVVFEKSSFIVFQIMFWYMTTIIACYVIALTAWIATMRE